MCGVALTSCRKGNCSHVWTADRSAMGRSVELELALLFLEAGGSGAENGGPW